MNIPKRLGHIWIGSKKPPEQWMRTWREKHPHWQYDLYCNEYLRQTEFRNQHLIDAYMKTGNYPGVSDLMRYEILLRQGGLLAHSDSECHHCTDELWKEGRVFSSYESEFLRGKLVTPPFACQPGNEFMELLVEELHKLTPSDLGPPWMSTGNLFVARMIAVHRPDIVIFPSHYFTPIHYEGLVYSGPDKIYAREHFGSTKKLYGREPVLDWIKHKYFRKVRRNQRRAVQSFTLPNSDAAAGY